HPPAGTYFENPQRPGLPVLPDKIDDAGARRLIDPEIGASRDFIVLEHERRAERGFRQRPDEITIGHVAVDMMDARAIGTLALQRSLRIVSDTDDVSLAPANHQGVQVRIDSTLAENIRPEARGPSGGSVARLLGIPLDCIAHDPDPPLQIVQ